MQGISFWCDECKKEIKKGSWGRHVFNQHNDDGRRPLLYCSEHKATFKSGIQLKAHLEFDHPEKGWDENLRSYKLSCKACKWELSVSEWEFHSEIDCKNGYKFLLNWSRDDFWCTLCGEKVAKSLAYEHMRVKHFKALKEALKENRLFYCKKCNEEVGNSWNDHVEWVHRNDSEKGAFYCPGLADLTKEGYEQL